MTIDDARETIEAFRMGGPREMAGKRGADLTRAWTTWATARNAAIRARLERGDEDSLVNFWMYGTSFTTRPRATARDLAAIGGRDRALMLLEGRLDDLVAALAAPGANERLRFARQVLERRHIDASTGAGQEQARAYLIDIRERALKETERYRRTLASASLLKDPDARLDAFAAVYRERGLSSDTSINADFALDHAIGAAKVAGVLGRVHRAGIVGPGLDFTDKAEGYDFYPVQTIQPFAVADALLRLDLASPNDLRVSTFDLSPRVNAHLGEARARAAHGEPYTVQLPLDADTSSRQWRPELVDYWQHFGGTIGEPVPPVPAPPTLVDLRVRAVRVRPDVVRSITPIDLNIVLERLGGLAEGDRYDLIVATNVLVYYEKFEQALAMENVAAMLRPGGLFITNYKMTPRPPFEPAAVVTENVFWDLQGTGDTLHVYRKR